MHLSSHDKEAFLNREIFDIVLVGYHDRTRHNDSLEGSQYGQDLSKVDAIMIVFSNATVDDDIPR